MSYGSLSASAQTALEGLSGTFTVAKGSGYSPIMIEGGPAVPEPGAGGLVALAAAFGYFRRRR